MSRPISLRRAVVAVFTVSVACVAVASLARPAVADEHVGGPAPEAVAACASRAAGDACTWQMKGHAKVLEGVCAAAPRAPTLACRPRPPEPRPKS